MPYFEMPFEKFLRLKPSCSNLPLQIALHYNALFSLIYVVLLTAASVQKIQYYRNYAQIVVLCVWLLIEPVRLYYGVCGNLKESVPHLSAFLLMTIFPQMPLVIYIAYFLLIRFPIDSILGSFMLIFLVIEFAFGWYTSRKVISNQTAQFMQLVEQD